MTELKSRFTLRIPSFTLQQIIREFTLSNRPWTAYNATKIERILRFYSQMPHGMYYSGFDEEKEEAVFKTNPILCDTTKAEIWVEELQIKNPEIKLLKDKYD